MQSQQIVARPAARHACLAAGTGRVSRSPVVVPRAAASVAKAESTAVEELVSRIKAAVNKPNSIAGPALLDAMLSLEKSKCPTDGWFETLAHPRARWRLIFTASSDQVIAASKKQANKGGIYFPIPAVQRFDATSKTFENGVFLGQIASLTFAGPYEASGRRLAFDVATMNIGVGPWRWSFALKKDAKPLAELEDSERRALPFFIYAYVDDEIIVARGRSGGLAVWAATSQEWEAKAGVLAVYK